MADILGPPTEGVSTPARPKLLDLFGGAQGAGVGYARAGFEVTSLDIEPHAKHPDVTRFVVSDAMRDLRDPDFLSLFDVVHASPPCQGYSTMNRWRGKTPTADLTPRLIGEVRDLLRAWGGVYVIENVVGARKHMVNPILLRGGHFALGVDRQRLFESNVRLTVPPLVQKRATYGIYGPLDGRLLFTRKDGSEYRAPRTLEQGQEAMGIDWMEWDDLREAIPPAYTEWIGRQLAPLFAERTIAHSRIATQAELDVINQVQSEFAARFGGSKDCRHPLRHLRIGVVS